MSRTTAKPRIALDLDGVVYNFAKTHTYMLRSRFGYPDDLREENTQSWTWTQEQVKPEHWRWLWQEGVQEGLFRYGHLYKGSIEGVKELATFATVSAVTSRPAQAVQDTMEWLAFMKLPVAEVHIIGEGKKPEVGRPFNLAIDDASHNAEDFVAAGVPTLLVNRPWNQGVEDSALLTRVYDWPDIVAVAREVLR